MAKKSDIIIDAGTSFSTDVHLTDENGDVIDLSGYVANSVMKKFYTSRNFTVFNTSINTASGVITLAMDPVTSANLSPGNYVYDVVMMQTGSNVITRVVEGIVTITPCVTGGVYFSNNQSGNYV